MIPKHPNTVVIKNKYYPQGLSEINIYNHYQQYKNSILEQVKNRDVMIFLKTDSGIVIKRKIKDKPIILNNQNYDDVISGRTLSLHCTMNRIEDICVIDIDAVIFNKAKEATKECYDVLKKFPIFQELHIRFTGKSSFHIFCKLTKKINIDSIRFLLSNIFKNSIISEKYTISKSRKGNIPNIDLFRNTYHGGFIIINSLSTIGLKCMEVKYNDLKNFTKEKAIIK